MNVDKKNLSIQILSIIGFILTIKLAIIYYVANYVQYALSSFCSINSFIDCDGAARTSVSQFLGIPLAYWGMFFYITIFFLTIVNKLKKYKFLHFLEVFKNPNSYIVVIGSIAFLCSMILGGISLFGIKKLCILCFITYFIDLAIALIAIEGGIKEYFLSFKTTFIDFIDGIKKYPKTFVTLLISVIVFLTYSGITYSFIPHIQKSKEIRKYYNMKVNPYKVSGNVLGNENGSVVIELYSDFVCPMCYVNNIMIHKAAKEYSNIKVVHHNYPFDTICNPYITAMMHPNACFMARASIAAEKQGNYWGMGSLLFERQPKNDEEVMKLAEEINLDMDKFLKDYNSTETFNKLDNEIQYAYEELGIDATPTMYVNGEQYVGIKPYATLKEILEKHGAKK